MAGPVLVTGMGVVSPIGMDLTTFAAALLHGRSGVTRLSDPAVLGDGPVAPLPPLDLAASLSECAALDRESRERIVRAGRRSPLPVRAVLVAATQAWQDAGLHARPVAADRIGLVVGGHNLTAAYAFDQYPGFLRERAYLPARYALHVQDTDHVATISQALRIHGEGCTVGASSASGNAALIHAARLVGAGAVDVCLAVGAMVRLSPLDRQGLTAVEALAASGAACAPLDRGRGGLVPGEAAACVVLEAARCADRRGATADAELSGYAMALDGNALAAPCVEGEVRVMTTALSRAGIDASQIDYVSAHVTGTPAGDDAELAALDRVFGLGTRPPWVNATKALVSHCFSAAAVVEAVATVIQLRDGFVHPNPTLTDPVDTSLRLVGSSPVRAPLTHGLSNAFGFGGFTSSVLLTRT